ncbi:MAG: hypothetical protein ACHQ4F_10430 [Candidatus Dormibacteria bacterium]
MPWAIVIRLLARLAASLFFWRIATSRRRAYAGGQPVPGATPKARIDAEAAVIAVRNSILLTWRALLTVAFLTATTVLLVAGVTIVVLTPRWLGALLLAAALATGWGTWFEGRVLVIALRMRNRRRRDERLRKTATS